MTSTAGFPLGTFEEVSQSAESSPHHTRRRATTASPPKRARNSGSMFQVLSFMSIRGLVANVFPHVLPDAGERALEEAGRRPGRRGTKFPVKTERRMDGRLVRDRSESDHEEGDDCRLLFHRHVRPIIFEAFEHVPRGYWYVSQTPPIPSINVMMNSWIFSAMRWRMDLRSRILGL